MADERLEIAIKAVNEASKALKDVQKDLGGLDDQAKKTGSGLGKLGSIAKGAAVAGLGALAAGLKFSIDQAIEAERVMAATGAVIKSTGGAAGMTADEIGGLADSLSRMSGIDDELIQSAENVMLTFTSIGEDVFPQAMEAALNMSVALGTDLQSAVIMVGKALQDPERGMTALRKAGVNVNEEMQKTVKAMLAVGDAAGAQAYILKELSTEFGGAAKAAGDTLAGKLGKAEIAIGNLGEAIGNKLIPVLGDAADALTILISGGEQIGDVFNQHIQEMAQRLKDGDETLQSFDAEILRSASIVGQTSFIYDDWGNIIGQTLNPAVAEQVRLAKAAADSYRDFGGRLLDSARAAEAKTAADAALLPTEEELEKATRAAAKASEEQAEKMEDARKAAADLTIGVYDLAQSLVKVGEATFVKQALEGLDGALKAGSISQADYRIATENLLLSSGLATEKSLAMANAVTYLSGLLSTSQISTSEYASAMQLIPVAARDSVVSMSELNIHIETARETALKARDAIGSVGMADAIASAGAASEDLTPKLSTLSGSMSATTGAASALAGAAGAARDAIDSIQDKTVTLTTIYRSLHITDYEGRTGKQFGGPVSADRPFLVGEAGREMFMPSINGSIIDNRRTDTMIALLQAIAEGMSRPNVNINGANMGADAMMQMVNAGLGRQSRSARVTGLGS